MINIIVTSEDPTKEFHFTEGKITITGNSIKNKELDQIIESITPFIRSYIESGQKTHEYMLDADVMPKTINQLYS